jgi:hypothetical protein
MYLGDFSTYLGLIFNIFLRTLKLWFNSAVQRTKLAFGEGTSKYTTELFSQLRIVTVQESHTLSLVSFY